MNPMNMLKGVAVASLVTASIIPGTTAAQTSDGDWKYEASIYAYLPTISGRSTFPPPVGSRSASIDIGTILDNLKFVFMGSLWARRDKWGVLADVIYMDLGNTKEQASSLTLGGAAIPAGVNAKVSYDLKGWVSTLAGTYRVVDGKDFTGDVVLGTRVLNLRPSVNWYLTGNVGSIPVIDQTGSREASQRDWDLIAGFKGRARFAPDGKWFVPYYLDIGAGESQFTWQATAGIGYSFGWGDVVASWRYLDYQMKSGRPLEELTFNGPVIAAMFRW
jgi:hypothetical protein